MPRLKPRALIPRKGIISMNISSSADVQVKRRFNVDIANCNKMHKRLLRFRTDDVCIWLEVPKDNREVLINVHILVTERKHWFESCDIRTNVIKGQGVSLRIDEVRGGTKRTYSFHSWETFEVFLSRLPSYMPSGKTTYITDPDGLPIEADDLLTHLHKGTGKISSVSSSRSSLQRLRYQMRNLGVAA